MAGGIFSCAGAKGGMRLIIITATPVKIAVQGHAGYAESGKDIVCVGVSALLQNTVKSILDLTDDQIKYELTPGSGMIEFKDLSDKGKLLMDSFFIGLCMIAEEYPDYVRLA